MACSRLGERGILDLTVTSLISDTRPLGSYGCSLNSYLLIQTVSRAAAVFNIINISYCTERCVCPVNDSLHEID